MNARPERVGLGEKVGERRTGGKQPGAGDHARDRHTPQKKALIEGLGTARPDIDFFFLSRFTVVPLPLPVARQSERSAGAP